jgi:hypothetical protein
MLKGFLWVLLFLVLANVVAFVASFVLLMFFGVRDTAQTPYGGLVGAAAFILMCVIGWRRRKASVLASPGQGSQ